MSSVNSLQFLLNLSLSHLEKFGAVSQRGMHGMDIKAKLMDFEIIFQNSGF